MERHQAQGLVDKRAAAWTHAKDLLERAGSENRALTSEEESTVEAALADVDKYDRQVALYEQEATLAARFDQAAEQRAKTIVDAGVSLPVDQVDGEKRYHDAWSNYIVRGYDELANDDRQLLIERDRELRALGVITGSGGGFTAPAEFWAKITETMLWYGGMMEVGVEKVTTSNGNPLSWPTNNDTTNTGAWVAENVDHSTATDLSFNMKTLYAHGLTSRVLKVSRQYLQDTAPQTGEAFIARKLGERLGRTLNTALTTGSGVDRPAGIINGLSTGKTTAGATAITFGELIDLEHSVDPAYRANGKYMLHDLIFAYVRKMVDSNGLPLYSPSYQVGAPSSINGRQYVINNDMDSTVATTKKTIAFGDFQSSYVWREVSGGGTLQRLDERYAELQQVGFIAFARYDGLVQDTSAVKLLVQA
jgi:HK97 family phage major capsid protein